MPFSKTTDIHTDEYWAGHFEDFLKPVIEEIGNIEAKRSDALRGDLLNQIIFALVNSDVVVADLTDSNPNVFWELGIRHSFKNGTITIMDNTYKLPFDLSKIGTLKYYPNNHIKNEQFKRNLKEAVSDCLSNPNKVDSYVLEAVSGRGSIYEIINKMEIQRKLDGLIDEHTYNFNLLDRMYKSIDMNKEQRELIKKDPANKEKYQSNIGMVSGFLRCSCVEFLLSTRYLEVDKSIYTSFGWMHDAILTINQFLTDWINREVWMEDWLFKHRKYYYEGFESCKKHLDTVSSKYK